MRFSQQLFSDEAQKFPFQNIISLVFPNQKEIQDTPAILSVDTERKPLTFKTLYSFLIKVNLEESFGIQKEDRVCVVLPNGPELAVSFLLFTSQCVFAPLNPTLSKEDFMFEFKDLKAKAIVVQKSFNSSLFQTMEEISKELNLQLINLIPDSHTCGLFSLESLTLKSQNEFPNNSNPGIFLNRTDVCLVLHTSGTTSKPKIVPLTHENLCVAAICIGSTLQLTSTDVGLNMMPLFHLHGIVVNILVSLLSEIPVLCVASFDAKGFYNWIVQFNITWYSAVPSMHQSILQFSKQPNFKLPSHKLSLIRNCSAALLPTVADELEKLFQCKALPTVKTFYFSSANSK